ncbi:MAG: HDOD domain-containing protein [Planctomycetes bacterium]|jgi:diguanylate cyclase (GGDEF)-like protein|nr:HDOD domain-containing protein [Planctomycetota bacterium]
MNDELLKRVLQCPRLPSLPTIAIEVIELCRQQDINIKQIATTISNDPALSSKILKTVNSSFYGLSQRVSTISHALVILGLNSVKTLALGFSLIDKFKDEGQQHFDLMLLWKRSLYGAVGSRLIAQHAGLLQHEEAFLAGLLKDIGVMAMIQTLGEEYVHVLAQVADQPHTLWQTEQQAYGADHAEIGAALGAQWKLPPVLTDPIRWHEQPDHAPTELRDMAWSVHTASRAADVFLCDDAQSVERYFECLNRAFDTDNAEGEKLLTTIGQSTREVGALFEIDTTQDRDAQTILAEANETLLELSLQTQQNATELANRNEQLREQVERDWLTGAYNRGKFNEAITEAYTHATQADEHLGLIFIDVDHFKSINDTHGHPVGDHVLISLANTLMTESPAEALVARYGGEEFAVILPAHDRKAAARAAELLRRRIEHVTIYARAGLELTVTASMGVASYDSKQHFRKPEQLVAAADKAVYAAKESGRNCVRVFTPRHSTAAA